MTSTINYIDILNVMLTVERPLEDSTDFALDDFDIVLILDPSPEVVLDSLVGPVSVAVICIGLYPMPRHDLVEAGVTLSAISTSLMDS